MNKEESKIPDLNKYTPNFISDDGIKKIYVIVGEISNDTNNINDR